MSPACWCGCCDPLQRQLLLAGRVRRRAQQLNQARQVVLGEGEVPTPPCGHPSPRGRGNGRGCVAAPGAQLERAGGLLQQRPQRAIRMAVAAIGEPGGYGPEREDGRSAVSHRVTVSGRVGSGVETPVFWEAPLRGAGDDGWVAGPGADRAGLRPMAAEFPGYCPAPGHWSGGVRPRCTPVRRPDVTGCSRAALGSSVWRPNPSDRSAVWTLSGDLRSRRCAPERGTATTSWAGPWRRPGCS